ncbi:MAG TPA: methyltransferase [Dermatophilaceae bacterium]|nr:methyltransferase [Dermatophilaceae bacterium]
MSRVSRVSALSRGEPGVSLPAPSAQPDLLRRLRTDLEHAAYRVDAVRDLLGPVAAGAMDREQHLPADLATAGDPAPLAVLVRLFALGRPVPVEHAAAALPALGPAGLLALGLARGDPLVATCDQRPYGDERHEWWVASDLAEAATGRPVDRDHVLGVGAASATLAAWTPRPVVARALDVGVGCGVQALHLSTHAAAVVGTDRSARALAFARFTALLNGVEVDLRAGDLLDPAGPDEYGLVVSNPPFVITPRRADVAVYEYRDGGLPGDALVERLVRGVGRRLAPGGIAQLLGNWEVRAGADWRDRLRAWLDGSGLDAWVVQRDLSDPAQYAELWARDGGHQAGSDEHDRLYAAWLADFAARGVAAVGFGVVTLQRPVDQRPPWQDLAEVSGPVGEAMGVAVLRGVRARTWLAQEGAAGLLRTAWRCADDVTEERHYRPGQEHPAVIVLRQGTGLRRLVQVDTVAAALVGACDGSLAAGQALDAIADLLDQDRAATRAQALPTLHGLVADGLLRPG